MVLTLIHYFSLLVTNIFILSDTVFNVTLMIDTLLFTFSDTIFNVTLIDTLLFTFSDYHMQYNSYWHITFHYRFLSCSQSPTIRFMEEIAVEMGVRMRPWRLLSDPLLGLCLLLGPLCPARYRLQGSGAWEPARHQVIQETQHFYSALPPSCIKLLKVLVLGFIGWWLVVITIIVYLFFLI